MNAAETLAIIQGKREEQRTEHEKKILNQFEIIKDKNATYEEKLNALLYISIPNEKDRDIYRERYYENLRLINLNPKFKKRFLEYFEEDKISSDEIAETVFRGKDRVKGYEFSEYNAGVYWLDNDDKSLW